MAAGLMALLISAVAAPPPALVTETEGQAIVLDGALLSIKGQRVQLADVAAPSPAQRCDTGRGFVPCGQAAVEMMRSLVAAGPVRCRVFGLQQVAWAARQPVWRGVCEIRDIDLGGALVQSGFGIPAAGSGYAHDGLSACVARQGLWAWSVESPWTFRRRREGEAVRPIFIGARSGTPCLRVLAGH
jgi:endonuclease YncB( thermonuclease family)